MPTLREELARLSLGAGRPGAYDDQVSPGHSQRMLQVTGELAGDPDQTIRHAVVKTCLWLKKSHGIELPDRAWDGAAFTLDELTTKRVEAVRIEAQDYWALRFDYPDIDVPQRSWITEVTVARPGDGQYALFGLRLTCVSSQGGPRPKRTIPRVVREVSRSPGLKECGWTLGESYSDLQHEEEVSNLVDLLTNPQRRRPVFVIAPIKDPEASRARARELANATPGAAHIVVINEQASWALTELVGRRLSVYGDAVRTYVPGFQIGDDPFRHPLMLRAKQEELEAANQLIDRLTQSALAASTYQRDWRRAMPSFADVKEAALRESRQSLEANNPQADDAVRQSLHEEIQYLRSRHQEEIEAYDSTLDEAYETTKYFEEENDRLRSEVFSLQCQIEQMRLATNQSGGEVAFEPEGPPPDYQTLLEWAENYLGERLEVTTRATREVKGAPREQIDRSWQALRILADQYRRMRLGEEGARASCEQALAEAGLEMTPIFSDDAAASQNADNYTVINHMGKRITLDMHLKRGVSHDPRISFRLYFTWDPERERAVIGPFPEHLRSRHS